jgi:cytochrome c-type biogenesis protein CcmH
MKKRIFSLFILFICAPLFAVQAIYPFANEKEEARFVALTQEIRCVVCQNQNIADSAAPLANDLRDKIYRMVLEKKSDDEIKNYLVKRYGEFILLKPRLQPKTYLLWAVPLILLTFTLLTFLFPAFVVKFFDYIAVIIEILLPPF